MPIRLSASLLLLSATLSAQTISSKITGMKHMDGLLPLDWDAKAGKLYLEIPQLDTDLLYSHSLPYGTGSNDLGLDRGQISEGQLVRFERTGPKVLLLDEPAAGMNYGEAEGLKTQIRWLRDTFDLSVVLVEHNMQVVMGVCEDIHVLDHGETIAHGTPEEVRQHPKVLAAYLGEEESESA